MLQYLDKKIVAIKTDNSAKPRKTASGYSRKDGSPTPRLVRLEGEKRWRRLMVITTPEWPSGTLFLKTKEGNRTVLVSDLPPDPLPEIKEEIEAANTHPSEALKSAPIRLVAQNYTGTCPSCGKEVDALSAMFHPGEGCEIDEEDEEDSEEITEEDIDNQPSPDDYIIRCDGNRYHAYTEDGGSKGFVGTFGEEEKAEDAVREHRVRTTPNYYPGVWRVSDHGNVSAAEDWSWEDPQPEIREVDKRAEAEENEYAEDKETNNGHGFIIRGKWASVGWFKTKAEAEKNATQLNSPGGDYYKVVPCDGPAGMKHRTGVRKA